MASLIFPVDAMPRLRAIDPASLEEGRKKLDELSRFLATFVTQVWHFVSHLRRFSDTAAAAWASNSRKLELPSDWFLLSSTRAILYAGCYTGITSEAGPEFAGRRREPISNHSVERGAGCGAKPGVW